MSRVVDRNGQCVWFNYTQRQGLPTQVAIDELYSGEYEKIVRGAFFDVLQFHPIDVLETFLYYKPRAIVLAVGRMLPSFVHLPASEPGRSILSLVVFQSLLLIGFVAARPPPAPFRDAAIRLRVLLPFLVAVLIPLMLTWAVEFTILDLMVYLLCGLLIAGWLVASCCVNFAIELREGVRLAEVLWPTDRGRGLVETGTIRRPAATR